MIRITFKQENNTVISFFFPYVRKDFYTFLILFLLAIIMSSIGVEDQKGKHGTDWKGDVVFFTIKMRSEALGKYLKKKNALEEDYRRYKNEVVDLCKDNLETLEIIEKSASDDVEEIGDEIFQKHSYFRSNPNKKWIIEIWKRHFKIKKAKMRYDSKTIEGLETLIDVLNIKDQKFILLINRKNEQIHDGREKDKASLKQEVKDLDYKRSQILVMIKEKNDELDRLTSEFKMSLDQHYLYYREQIVLKTIASSLSPLRKDINAHAINCGGVSMDSTLYQFELNNYERAERLIRNSFMETHIDLDHYMIYMNLLTLCDPLFADHLTENIRKIQLDIDRIKNQSSDLSDDEKAFILRKEHEIERNKYILKKAFINSVNSLVDEIDADVRLYNEELSEDPASITVDMSLLNIPRNHHQKIMDLWKSLTTNELELLARHLNAKNLYRTIEKDSKDLEKSVQIQIQWFTGEDINSSNYVLNTSSLPYGNGTLTLKKGSRVIDYIYNLRDSFHLFNITDNFKYMAKYQLFSKKKNIIYKGFEAYYKLFFTVLKTSTADPETRDALLEQICQTESKNILELQHKLEDELVHIDLHEKIKKKIEVKIIPKAPSWIYKKIIEIRDKLAFYDGNNNTKKYENTRDIYESMGYDTLRLKINDAIQRLSKIDPKITDDKTKIPLVAMKPLKLTTIVDDIDVGMRFKLAVVLKTYNSVASGKKKVGELKKILSTLADSIKQLRTTLTSVLNKSKGKGTKYLKPEMLSDELFDDDGFLKEVIDFQKNIKSVKDELKKNEYRKLMNKFYSIMNSFIVEHNLSKKSKKSKK